MAEDTAPPSNGTRNVSNWELKQLNQEIMHKLEIISMQMASITSTVTTQTGQIENNKDEINKTRTHVHDIVQTIQRHEGLYAILSPDTARELVQELPFIQSSRAMLERRGLRDVSTPAELEWVQTAAREITKDEIKDLAAGLDRRKKHDARLSSRLTSLEAAVFYLIIVVIGGTVLVPLLTSHHWLP